MKKITCLLICCFGFLMVSCIDQEETYEINPDGSAKVELTLIRNVPAQYTWRPSPDGPSMLETYKSDFKKYIRGVSQWEEMKTEVLPSGKVKIKATFYTADINTVRFNKSLMIQSRIHYNKESDKAQVTLYSKPIPEVKVEENNLSKEDQLIKQASMLDTYAFYIQNFKWKINIKLKGDVTASGFKETDQGWTFEMNEIDIKEYMKGEKSDKLFSLVSVRQSRNNLGTPISILKEAPKLNWTNAGTIFEYDQSLKTAKEAIVEKDQEAASSIPEVVKVKEQAKDLEIINVIFNAKTAHSEPLYTIMAALTLPRSYVNLDSEGELIKAIADNGNNLAEQSGSIYAYQGHNYQNRDLKNKVNLQIKMSPPGSDIKKIKVLEGRFKYKVAGKINEIKLGSLKLEQGAKVENGELEIKGLDEQSWGNKTHSIRLKANYNSNKFKEIKFFDKDGTELESSSHGHSSSNHFLTQISYAVSFDDLKEVEVRKYEFADTKDKEITFSIEDFPVTGIIKEEKLKVSIGEALVLSAAAKASDDETEENDLFLSQSQMEFKVPGDHNRSSYSLTLVAETKDEISTFLKSELTKGHTDTGQSLVGSGYNKTFTPSPWRNSNNKFSFTLNLNLPQADAKKIKYLEGVIRYNVAKDQKVTDLGTVETKKGTKIPDTNMSIKSLRNDTSGNYSQIEVSCNLPRNTFKELQFFTEDGKRLEANRSGSSWGQDTYTTLYFNIRSVLPEKIQIKLVEHKDIVEKEIPFIIKDYPINGRMQPSTAKFQQLLTQEKMKEKNGEEPRVQVAQCSYVYASPWNGSEENLSLTLSAKTDNVIISTESAEIFEAITDSGTNLVTEQKANQSNIEREHKKSVFSMFKLSIPGPKDTSFAKITGMFKVNTSHKDEKLSDEEISLENGFVSEEHQLKMETVQRYENDNWRKVRLTFGGQAFKDHHIKGLEFSDLFGNPIDADEDGRSTSNNRPRKIYYRFKTELPDEIMFTIVKYGEVKTEEIPFQIENVSLLGKKQNTGKKNE